MPDKNLVEIMADAYKLAPAEFVKTIKTACFPRGQATDEQLYLFLSVAREHDLNPFTREIYAFVSEKTGQMQSIVGVDGWAKIINRHPAFDGMEFDDQVAPGPGGKVIAITCRIYRKDRSHPIEATEYMIECKRQTAPWQQWERRMLRHKAMIQTGRYAFGLAGIIDPDELERYYDVEIKAQRLAEETVTLSLDAPVDDAAPRGGEGAPRDTAAPVAGAASLTERRSPGGASDSTGGPASSGAAPTRGAAPRRGRPPKNQEPQAPSKASAASTPPAQAGAAASSPEPQPEPRGPVTVCGYCHQVGHGWNECPVNRSAADEGVGEPVTEAELDESKREFPDANGAATVSDEDQTEAWRIAKLLRPKSAMSFLQTQLKAFNVEDISELPADKLTDLIRRMQANA